MVETLAQHAEHRALHLCEAAGLVAMDEPLGRRRLREHDLPDLVEPPICLVAVVGHPVPLGQLLHATHRAVELVRPASLLGEGGRVEVAVILAEDAVDVVGPVEGGLDAACGGGALEQHVVDGIVPEHAGVVLVAHLVLPRAEAATRPDAVAAERLVRRVHVHVALDVGHGVAVLEPLVPDRGD
eukprot:scaffold108611_cov50-Phaeocystis_antarctica.AAC.1